MKRTASFFAVCMSALVAQSASVTIDSVTQRWPWNNKIDITYTVTDGQRLTADASGDVYCKLVFTAVIGGKTYTIDGVKDIGASANGDADGTRHTVTWTPPEDLKVKDLECTMKAELFSSDTPSGDDYMIVDLATGVVTYEGLLASQELSNARYNTDVITPGATNNVYKETKLVLRKIPVGTYMTGGETYEYKSGNKTLTNINTRTYWNLANYNDGATYYMSIYPVTQAQYVKIYGGNPSSKKTHLTNSKYLSSCDVIAHRPVETVTWNQIRGDTNHTLGGVTPKSNGYFLQRLNAKTLAASGMKGFDMPTEVMTEIAARAGTTTIYWWGDTKDAADADGRWHTINKSNGYDCYVAVGTVKPNPWGLYDVAGNVHERLLDEGKIKDLADIGHPYKPYYAGKSANRMHRGGGYVWDNTDSVVFRAASRHYESWWANPNTQTHCCGFRVAMLAK